MTKTIPVTVFKAVLLAVVLANLQACAPAAVPSDHVTEAFNTSGMISVHPYTRTIFSTHNF